MTTSAANTARTHGLEESNVATLVGTEKGGDRVVDTIRRF
jgi:hypothetical protein